mgnify:CR=1 FL=1
MFTKALISVYDKRGLVKLAKFFKSKNIEILSSTGTANLLNSHNIKCTEISDYINHPEILDGRVKTLHPKIHSGILFNRSNNKHKLEMKNQDFKPIDLVIINFYPFKEILNKTKINEKIIENIDIGGPTMVRAAAKNYKDVTIITDKSDYIDLINELKKNNGNTSLNFRERMASKAFNLTSYYDSIVAEWFNEKLGIKFPEKKTFFGRKLEKLSYGENPHQSGSIYISDLKKDSLDLNKISGKDLSYNNYNDIFAGLDILFSEKKLSMTVIIKHANPCGVSINKSPFLSFKNAQASDPISAFGGVVACNFRINLKLASEISKTFFEVIMAKGFDKDALKILKMKKNMRLIDISNFKDNHNVTAKIFDNAFLLQDKDTTVLNKKKLKFVTKIKPTVNEIKEIIFAYKVCKFVKSNAIVIVKEHSTIGIGAGQQNRLDSCRIATQKAKKFQPKKLINSIAASDAFFPFADGIENLINSGVKVIVQPGGSIRDAEVIKAANKAKIKMIFTGTRHFNH